MRVKGLSISIFTCIVSALVPITSPAIGGEIEENGSDPVGHLQPLGSHRESEGKVQEVDGFLEPIDFYTNHVLASAPVLFKGAARDLPAYSLWSDAYLRENFGSIQVDIENGKKEDRKGKLLKLPLGHFLDIYNESNMYMVQDIVPEMGGDLILPRPIQCGGFQHVLAVGVIWFSSGGTTSVLHSDDFENINCLLDGEKRIVFIDKKFKPFIEAQHYVKDKTYSEVDVEKVDLHKFPHLSEVEWWEAKMEKGDCLYLPVHWYHSVGSSKGRNLAVNLWFSHIARFNETDCIHDPPPLAQIKVGESLEQVRHGVFSLFEDLDYIRLEDAVERWGDALDHPSLIQEIFEMIDEDRDLILTWEEVFRADIQTLVRDFPELVGEDPEQEATHDEL